MDVVRPVLKEIGGPGSRAAEESEVDHKEAPLRTRGEMAYVLSYVITFVVLAFAGLIYWLAS